MIDYTDLIKQLRESATDLQTWLNRVDDLVPTPGDLATDDRSDVELMTQAADAITALEYALARSQPLIDRNGVLEEAAKAMDEQRHLIERQEIEKANRKGPTAGVLYNPEQTFWKLAATIIRELKDESPIYDVSDTGIYAK